VPAAVLCKEYPYLVFQGSVANALPPEGDPGSTKGNPFRTVIMAEKINTNIWLKI